MPDKRTAPGWEPDADTQSLTLAGDNPSLGSSVDTVNTQPFGSTALEYYALGWASIPMPERGKWPPLTGTTGEDGQDLNHDGISRHARLAPQKNIAVRMPVGVVGIDIDAYADKVGAQTLTELEARLGPLPHGPMSTSRTDGVSGIRLFQIDPALVLPNDVGPDIERIDRGHRYAMVWPSIHPEGRQYRWVDSATGQPIGIPASDLLPHLPAAWADYLSTDRKAAAKKDQNAGSGTFGGPNAYDLAASNGIPEGEKHDGYLAAAVASWVARGYTREAIKPLWQSIITNTTLRDPSWTWNDGDFARHYDRAHQKYAPETTVRDDPDGDGDDQLGGQIMFARMLADAHHGRLMYVYGIGWHYWDGKRWAEDQRGMAQEAVKEVLTDALASTVKHRNDALRKAVQKCETANGISGILSCATSEPAFAFGVEDLDADPNVLNVDNGTLDLISGRLRPHDPMDRLTKVTRAAYHTDAAAPRWHTFLHRVLPDPDVRDYLQRVVGVALTGSVREHILPILVGPGQNGKGTAYEALLFTLGGYGHPAEQDLLIASKSNAGAASPQRMALRGKRFVVTSETEEGAHLATAMVKHLTGGDPITARPLYGKPVTFEPSHTVFLVTNKLPVVPGDDAAIWRRITVIKFGVRIPDDERDGDLGNNLELEADGILAWAVRGYQEYLLRGRLDAPAAVKLETDGYRFDSDPLRRFIDDRCNVGPAQTVAASKLWDAWQDWCHDEGVDHDTRTAFGRQLTALGYAKTRDGQGRGWTGVGLAAQLDPPVSRS